MKKITIILSVLLPILIVSTVVWAANVFPTTLNSWQSGDIIEESWANALENKIGIDSSAVATSLDYLVKNVASKLGKIASLTPTDGNFIVGDGSNWVAESGATARTSIGLGSVENTALSTWAGTSNITTVGTTATGTWEATDVGVAHGGTGKSSWTQYLIPYADTTTSFSQIAIGSAGQVLTSAGAGSVAAFAAPVVTLTNTITFTNKRITQRVETVADGATITPTGDASDMYTVTALAQGATIAAPSGTPTNGQKLILRIKDNGTTRTLSWNAIYNVVGVTLPTDTTAGKTHYIGLIYNTANSKWDVVAVIEES